MKKMNKVMSLLLAVTMVCMTGVMSFADVGDELTAIPCLTCSNSDSEHVHGDRCYSHTWNDGEVKTEATCTEEGETVYTCTVQGCQKTKAEINDKLSHTYGEDDIETIDATCTQPGEIVKTCSICKTKSCEKIPMNGHTFVEGNCTTCQAQMQLVPGTDYGMYITDGTTTIKFKTYKAGSNSVVVLPAKSDIVSTKTEISGGMVCKLTLVGFSNDGGKTIFQYGSELNGSIVDAMIPTGTTVNLEAVYKTEDGLDQLYDYTESGKTVDRKTMYSTSDGIAITLNKDSKQIIVTIPKEYAKEEVSVDATAAIEQAWAGTYMPGGAGKLYSIVIDNQSDKEFHYKANSFIIQSPSFSPDGTTYDFENEVKGYITGARTFDGETPYYTYGTIRTSNAALKALYEITDSRTKLTDTQLLDSNLEKALQNHGYAGGIADLAEYYLDYINAMKGTNYTNLKKVPDSILTTIGPFGGYVVNSYAKESNAEVAGAGYNYFYNRLLSVVPQDNIKDNEGIFSIGNYMNGKTNYESYCTSDWAKISTGNQAVLTAMAFYINGPYCTNPYQYMEFGFQIGFQLTSKVDDRPTVDPPVNPPVVDPIPPVTPTDPTLPLPDDEYLPGDEDTNNDGETDNNQQLPDDEMLIEDQENEDQPQTGDENRMGMYGILALLATGGILAIRRKRTEND